MRVRIQLREKKIFQITFATGLTAQEALVLGYLPWKVQCARTPPPNGRPEKDLRLALEEEEKKTVLGPGSIQRHGVLLFAREEDAFEACRQGISKMKKMTTIAKTEKYSEMP